MKRRITEISRSSPCIAYSPLLPLAASAATASQCAHLQVSIRSVEFIAANKAFLQELTTKIAAARYKDVEVEPRMFFATAIDSAGNSVGLVPVELENARGLKSLPKQFFEVVDVLKEFEREPL